MHKALGARIPPPSGRPGGWAAQILTSFFLPSVSPRRSLGGEQNGIAGWNVFYESGIDSSMGQGKRTYYRCTTFAHFNSNGTIVRIEVRNSRFCDRRFENQFEAMTRDDVVSRLGASPT